jgi:hypothetical protein
LNPKRQLLYLIPFVLGLAGWYFLDERDLPAGIRPLKLAQDEACFETAPTLIASLGRHEADEIAIFTNGMVKWRVCDAGQLSFTARGSIARERGSHLVVSLQDQVLWEGEVVEPQDFEIALPGPGWLTLAFVNDYYNPPEDRNLYISSLAFEPAPPPTP